MERRLTRNDPIYPGAALLPLSEPGGYVPIEHTPGTLRPFAATLAVVPASSGSDETTATRDNEVKQTQYTDDSVLRTDAVTIVVTDA